MSKNSLTRTILLVVALMVLFNVAGYATGLSTFRLRVEDTATGIGRVITDNVTSGIGNLNGDNSSTAGTIFFSGYVGNAFVTIYGTSASFGGGTGLLTLGARVQSVSEAGATIRITLEDSNYSGPTSTFTGAVSGFDHVTLGTTSAATLVGAVSSVNFQTWINVANTTPYLGLNSAAKVLTAPTSAALEIPVGSIAAFSGTGTSSLSATESRPDVPASASYALYSQATIAFSGQGAANFTISGADPLLAPTPPPYGLPEPTSLLLLGSGLVGLGALVRRKR
jgi:hypothetical protein